MIEEEKYRIWNPSKQIMEYHTYLIASPDSIIMPCLRFKDKYNNDIYVSDILQYTKHKGYLMDSCIMIIKYFEDLACYGYTKNNKNISSIEQSIRYPLCMHDEIQEDIFNHCFIIGNIYETK